MLALEWYNEFSLVTWIGAPLSPARQSCLLTDPDGAGSLPLGLELVCSLLCFFRCCFRLKLPSHPWHRICWSLFSCTPSLSNTWKLAPQCVQRKGRGLAGSGRDSGEQETPSVSRLWTVVCFLMLDTMMKVLPHTEHTYRQAGAGDPLWVLLCTERWSG